MWPSVGPTDVSDVFEFIWFTVLGTSYKTVHGCLYNWYESKQDEWKYNSELDSLWFRQLYCNQALEIFGCSFHIGYWGCFWLVWMKLWYGICQSWSILWSGSSIKKDCQLWMEFILGHFLHMEQDIFCHLKGLWIIFGMSIFFYIFVLL